MRRVRLLLGYLLEKHTRLTHLVYFPYSNGYQPLQGLGFSDIHFGCIHERRFLHVCKAVIQQTNFSILLPNFSKSRVFFSFWFVVESMEELMPAHRLEGAGRKLLGTSVRLLILSHFPEDHFPLCHCMDSRTKCIYIESLPLGYLGKRHI